MVMKSIGNIIVLTWTLALFASAGVANEPTAEELERWFNSDNFDLPVEQKEVNDGTLVFLANPPKDSIHHHHNSLTIYQHSLADGWVKMEQCHANLDRVSAAQIVFNKNRVKDLTIIKQKNITKAWVEGASVQMEDIKTSAVLCLQAWTRALFINDDGSYILRNGPFMRRFLDGYFPMRVSMDIGYENTGLKPITVAPTEQKGFNVWRKKNRIGFDAIFEGKLKTEFGFEIETLL